MRPTADTLVEKLPRPLRRHRMLTPWMRLTRDDPLRLVRFSSNDALAGAIDTTHTLVRPDALYPAQ